MEEEKITNEKPISLYPLTVDEALTLLLRVKPPKKTRKKTVKKHASK
jgi:hypothetical protein